MNCSKGDFPPMGKVGIFGKIAPPPFPGFDPNALAKRRTFTFIKYVH